MCGERLSKRTTQGFARFYASAAPSGTGSSALVARHDQVERGPWANVLEVGPLRCRPAAVPTIVTVIPAGDAFIADALSRVDEHRQVNERRQSRTGGVHAVHQTPSRMAS